MWPYRINIKVCRSGMEKNTECNTIHKYERSQRSKMKVKFSVNVTFKTVATKNFTSVTKSNRPKKEHIKSQCKHVIRHSLQQTKYYLTICKHMVIHKYQLYDSELYGNAYGPFPLYKFHKNKKKNPLSHTGLKRLQLYPYNHGTYL